MSGFMMKVHRRLGKRAFRLDLDRFGGARRKWWRTAEMVEDCRALPPRPLHELTHFVRRQPAVLVSIHGPEHPLMRRPQCPSCDHLVDAGSSHEAATRQHPPIYFNCMFLK
jgi:hypothetical protein